MLSSWSSYSMCFTTSFKFSHKFMLLLCVSWPCSLDSHLVWNTVTPMFFKTKCQRKRILHYPCKQKNDKYHNKWQTFLRISCFFFQCNTYTTPKVFGMNICKGIPSQYRQETIPTTGGENYLPFHHYIFNNDQVRH